MEHRSPLNPAVQPGAGPLLARQPLQASVLLVLSVLGWAFLAWVALDMETPVAQAMMPDSPQWEAATVLAVWAMWAVMMAAMMLPSAWPMVLTFTALATRNGEGGRGRAFVAAYLAVWAGFSALATLAQWALQALGWTDPMAASRSPLFTGVLLVLAGVYQFSPVKDRCLTACRAPLAFLLGEWRPGLRGALVMGLRHGLLCVGCCWALMALLFAGGVMNLPWIAALSLAVAVEKLAPGGRLLAGALGGGLIAAGALKLLVLAG